LEEKNKRKRPRDMFRTESSLYSLSPKQVSKKGRAGELINEKDKNLERWKQYTAELYKIKEDFTDFTYKK